MRSSGACALLSDRHAGDDDDEEERRCGGVEAGAHVVRLVEVAPESPIQRGPEHPQDANGSVHRQHPPAPDHRSERDADDQRKQEHDQRHDVHRS
jgi:hypothetical protein